jgi:hypothetical protein
VHGAASVTIGPLKKPLRGTGAFGRWHDQPVTVRIWRSVQSGGSHDRGEDEPLDHMQR